jgi:hypothetical protein
MKVKRYLLLAVVAVALVSAALPVFGLRVGAAGRAAEARLKPVPAAALASPVAGQQVEFDGSGQTVLPVSGEVFGAAGDLMLVRGYCPIPATETIGLL